MNSLLQLTIDAHGGLERWRRFEYVTAHLRSGGILRRLKHQQGVLDDVNVRVALRREWTSHSPFLKSQPADIVRTSPCGHRNYGRTRRRRALPTSRLVRGHRVDTPWGSVATRVLRRLRDVDLPDDAVPLCGGWASRRKNSNRRPRTAK